MKIKEAIARVTEHQNLSRSEMAEVMKQVMTGQCTDAQIAGFLIGLRMKGESTDEITAAAEIMRELAKPVQIDAEGPMVDLVGTGGDGASLFNVSTAAAFVVAASGGFVAKHGNRSVSSKSGSADLLEQAGINIALEPEQVASCVEQVGVGFMFAPTHHSAMKHAIGPRRELGVRTLFNILGPMTNPAGVKRQLVGVYSAELCRPIAEVLKNLGAQHVMVVHSADGLDEISLAETTHVVELKNGAIEEYTLSPEQFGIAVQDLDGLEVSGSEESLALIRDALGKNKSELASKAADLIALNAGAGIYLAGLATTLAEGIAMAQDAIESGLARQKMSDLAALTELMSLATED